MRSPAVCFAIVLAAVLGADAAVAQTNPISRPAARQAPPVQQEGFFRPTPDGDPSLTRYRPPPETPQPQPAVAHASPTDPRLMRGADSTPASAALAIEQARWIEEQADRSLREAERDRAVAAAVPPPVAPGAYDATTSERDR